MTGQPGMTGQEAARLAAARRGYGQSDAPPVPPGMYFDPGSGVVLPEGVRLASRGRLGAAFCLAIPLFAVTLGVGYIIWGVVSWGRGSHTRATATAAALLAAGRRAGQPAARTWQCARFSGSPSPASC